MISTRNSFQFDSNRDVFLMKHAVEFFNIILNISIRPSSILPCEMNTLNSSTFVIRRIK